MLKSIKRLRLAENVKNGDIYRYLLDDINKLDYTGLKDEELKLMSAALINRARNGVCVDQLLVKAFALVREVSRRVLGLHPFDVQIIGAIGMHYGNIVEMQTGEGKTLVAVLPAYLNALSGKGVHVLTFNDYLAQRDATWMGPIYNFLGLTVGYVQEGMHTDERKKAYGCDITYVTAKEAGFDYLRGFLCMDTGELVHRVFNYAVVDEADSILIDEARIPLVIAGETPDAEGNLNVITEVIRKLKPQIDYDTDEYARNVFLTDTGIERVESILGCDLYSDENIALLTKVNNALHAEVLLKRDTDYIVRDGKIEIIDEFTGRVADKRHWTDGLQGAVEAKEGLNTKSKGKIMGSITMQSFIGLYPKICGMTGTAACAAEEFKEFYGMNVVVVPTNRPCIRVDYPDLIFTHKEAKQKALVEEIVRVHATGRPILIGTGSVEESEQLADALKGKGIICQVLNAKNDEMEAKIIAKAGLLGSVTVSTNMAGRGTDIKLGRNEQEHEKVASLGGLYVIGTNRHESRRIDNQLRGRAGRQGDPGGTRFFISLTDDLMKRYRIDELIPERFYPAKQYEPIDNPVIKREAARAQRIVEGQNFDIRKGLWRYSYMIEKQRQIIHLRRDDILMGRAELSLLSTKAPERYSLLCETVGERVLKEVERQITLFHINECWADYLDYISYTRESMLFMNVAGKSPLDEFNRVAIDAFENLLQSIDEKIVDTFNRAEITAEGIDMDKEGLKGPSSTWTYLVNDNADQLGIIPICNDPIAAVFNAPLLLGLAVYNRWFRKR